MPIIHLCGPIYSGRILHDDPAPFIEFEEAPRRG